MCPWPAEAAFMQGETSTCPSEETLGGSCCRRVGPHDDCLRLEETFSTLSHIACCLAGSSLGRLRIPPLRVGSSSSK